MAKKGANKQQDKKSANKQPQPDAVSKSPVQVTARWRWADRPDAMWLEDLTPEELELEKERQKEREKKAKEEKEKRDKEIADKKYWENERQKAERQKADEDKKLEAQFQKTKERAKQEGILEACEYPDGSWYVKLAGGLWKECEHTHYCPHCDKPLNEHTLEAHLDSIGHKKKMSWLTGQPTSSPAPSSSAAPARASPPEQVRAPPAAPGCAMELPDWQEMAPDGCLRCKPCGKILDGCHESSVGHVSRLAWWRESWELKSKGYPAPTLPYLAYVPCDDCNPSSERRLKCLLCNKWCQDETSHTGTNNQPSGSKDHVKNLRNYWIGDAYWTTNVAAVRNKWHPLVNLGPRVPACGPPTEPARDPHALAGSYAALADPDEPPEEDC